MWVSEEQLPCNFTFKRNPSLRFDPNQIGFYCWHDYKSNPRTISLQISENNQNYIDWDTFLLDKKVGDSIFKIKQLPAKYLYYRFIILSNYGDEVTYLNTISIFYLKELKLHRTIESLIISEISVRKANR
jgi:hypothetical protein